MSGGVRPAKQPSLSVQVFSIQNMITKMPGLPDVEGMSLNSNTILLAIETGLGVEDAKTRATVRYHEASGLLFVRGTKDQIKLVREITVKLESDLQRRRNAAVQASFQKRSQRKVK